jgi:protein-histidine N-methyltransferase
LKTLPSKISYGTLKITSPKGNAISIPRRELFDIRVQSMAEDDGTDPDLMVGLTDNSDIRTNVYEGGFKNWECSIDLVRFLLDRGPRKDLDDLHRVDHIIELGAGNALPTLTLLHHALTSDPPIPLTVTICDYNSPVLRLLTIANLLLLHICTLADPTTSPFSDALPNPLHPASPSYAETGDLDITPAVLDSFQQRLDAAAISIDVVSGSWTPVSPFVSLIPSAPSLRTLVLAAETIYSPDALTGFTAALAALLKRVRAGKAVVAAKKVYFGVGGGVEMFRDECSKAGMVAYEMDFEGLGDEGGGGVRRSIVEVQLLGGGEVGHD